MRKAHVDGIQLDGYKTKHILSVAFIEEAVILSDLYNLNEFTAVELLIEAESQMQFFPGLTRGLTAILLYYDAKKSLVNTLKLLLQARKGRTWSLLDETTCPPELIKFISDFSDKLVYDGLINNILKQIEAYDWPKEQEQLLREGGLGNAKHRKQVKGIFDEVKCGLAECVFNCACQSPLNKSDSFSVLNHLKTKAQLNAKSQLEMDNIYLIMSLLYSFDCSCLENKTQGGLF